MNTLNNLNSEQFKDFVFNLKTLDYKSNIKKRVRYSGNLRLENNSQYYKIDDIVKVFDQYKEIYDRKTNRSIVKHIRSLEQKALDEAKNAGIISKVTTTFTQYVKSFVYDRHTVLDKIEFPGKIAVTTKKPFRTMILKDKEEVGAVACRVRGECAGTAPHKSREGVIEGAGRSFLRMNNLIAVRGETPGARMVGPCDYFGNVEAPHKHWYTLDIDADGVPTFLIDENENSLVYTEAPKKYTIDPKDVTTSVAATWHKGTNPNIHTVQDKYKDENKPVLGESLFPNSGILEIEGDREITLKKFDAREIDLSPFKARLVNNQIPFKITSEEIKSSDDYRAVTYLYEPNYADEQVKNGGGLFLETHGFAQTMTPIDQNAKGFVTLGRWTDEEHTKLELIGVEIPFGYTLIIEKDCIHGDTNLSGMFLMCMTSNHKTMGTADTVFLKNTETKTNISICIETGDADIQAAQSDIIATRPLAVFNKDGASEVEKFKAQISKTGVIFNPLRKV